MSHRIEQELDALNAMFRRLHETPTEDMTPGDLAHHNRLLAQTQNKLNNILDLSRELEEMYLGSEEDEPEWDEVEYGDEPGINADFMDLTEGINAAYISSDDVSLDDQRQLLDYELMVLTYAKHTTLEAYEQHADMLIDQIGICGLDSLRREERLFLDTYASRLRLDDRQK